MRRSRVWLLLVLLLAIALVTSGCFQIRTLKMNKRSIAAGESITVRTEAYPISMSTTDTQEGYYFLLIGYDNIDFDRASAIDLDGNWGGPHGKGNNTDLKNLLLTDGICNAAGIDAEDMEASFANWRALVSLTEFGPEGATTAELELRLWTNLYFEAPAGVGDDDRGDLVIFTGTWDDDLFNTGPGQTGVPAAEEVACTGLVSFSVPYTD